jgi:ABC-type lipoprotein export system ATPase subunit
VKLLQLLRTIVDEAGVTLVMATHDPTVEQYADATYRLQDGEIISRTTRTEANE